MVSEGVSRVSISVPSRLLKEFDEAVEKLKYDRSKAVQLAIRNFLTDYRASRTSRTLIAGALVYIYDHDVKGLENERPFTNHL